MICKLWRGRGSGRERRETESASLHFSVFPLFSFSQSVSLCFWNITQTNAFIPRCICLYLDVSVASQECSNFYSPVLFFSFQDSTDPLESRFLLSDHLFAKAKIPPTDKVCLWLGVSSWNQSQNFFFFHQNKLLHCRHMTQEYFSRE